MSLLLDLIYLIALVVASPWIVYRLLSTGGWRTLASRFGSSLADPVQDSVWLHGSSAGEVSLLKPLIALFERDMPGTPLVISSFTSTGLEVARAAYPQHRVIAFPIDFSFIVRRFLRHLDPRLVIIVESEFWPNFLAAVRARNIPAVVLNGKMSAKSYRIHARTRLIPRVLRALSLIAVQTEEHAARLRSLGVADDRIVVTGNMKYDLARDQRDPERIRQYRRALRYDSDETVIIGGSLHEREDEALLDAFDTLAHDRYRVSLIIVPRYPTHATVVKQRVEERGRPAVLKTSVDDARAQAPGHDGVLIVDTVGELGQLYGIADIAFVGGSLFYRGANKGGHNLMEPAVLGLAVLFGPYNFSFKETVEDLLRAEAGILVRDGVQLGLELKRLVENPQEQREMGTRARDVVVQGRGATRRNYELIVDLLAARHGKLQGITVNSTMPPAASDPDPS